MAAETQHRKFGIGTPVTWIKGWFKRNSLALLVVAGLLVLWEFYSRFINTRGDAYFPSIEIGRASCRERV